MYYDGTDGSMEETGLAYSIDGLYWEAYSGNPVLAASPSPAWIPMMLFMEQSIAI